MTLSRLLVPLLVAGLVAGLGSVAAADPVVTRVDAVVTQARRLDVRVEATFAAAGEIVLAGDVAGTPVSIRRAARAGSGVFKLRVDPRKLGIRKLETALRFDLTLTARETGGAEITRDVDAQVAVPCIVLPGISNEVSPGSMNAFADGMNAAAGTPWTRTGDHPTLVVHDYPSLTKPMPKLAAELDRLVRKTLKGTVFAKADLVGYSYGGIVVRHYLAKRGGARVRRCLFLVTPNEGASVAYIGVGLLESGQLDPILAANSQLAAVLAEFLNQRTKTALRNVYPTYTWAVAPGPTPGSTVAVPRPLYEGMLGDSSTSLSPLQAIDPPAGVAYHAFFYTSTPPGELGTVDVVDVSKFASGVSNLDPADIATGEGDGVVPAHSVRMDEVGAWAQVMEDHDLGVGTHVGLRTDANAMAAVAAVLAQ